MEGERVVRPNQEEKKDTAVKATGSHAVSLWRHRDYLLLWGGQVVSNVGSGVSQIAFPLLVLAVTHSPAQAGFVAAARALAYVVFVLPAGALVDRWDRKRLMIYCDVGRALCLLRCQSDTG